MALRRLYPDLKILFISGSTFTLELLGRAPLDWLKLPSYKTEVVNGISRGVPGNSMLQDQELGELRRQDLAHFVGLYRPRLVLVDHTPQGKHRELLQALETTGDDCQWVLGVRGVVGSVKQAAIEVTQGVFKKYYSDLLWYGDRAVLGDKHCQMLARQYCLEPYECGYVSRLKEYRAWNDGKSPKHKWAGVVSVPWHGEESLSFLRCLAGALADIPCAHGRWCLFIDPGMGEMKTVVEELFLEFEHCQLETPGNRYGDALMNARSAVIYGGYNSLVDILFAGIPTLVILREMQDKEQQIHVERLEAELPGRLTSVSETEVGVEGLKEILLQNILVGTERKVGVKIDGASRAAHYLHSKLR
jgi:predicted glycosyltransferase